MPNIDAKTCQEKCKNKTECQWHSYDSKQKLCVHFETCMKRNNQTDYISGQSGCPYEVENPEVDNPEVDNFGVDNPDVDSPEVDNPEVNNPDVDSPEVDNPEVDNPKLDNLYQCNVTGMCKVSHKHRVQNHNIDAQTS